MNAGRTLGVLLAVQAGLAALAFLLGWLLGVRWWEELRLDGWFLAGWGMGVGLALASKALFLTLARRVADVRWFLYDFLVPAFSDLPPGGVVLLGVATGFAEEALFRGVLLQTVGLLPSSLLFGLLHTGDRRLMLPGLWAVLVGAGLGWMVLATSNLSACMALHAANNMVSLWLLQGIHPCDGEGTGASS